MSLHFHYYYYRRCGGPNDDDDEEDPNEQLGRLALIAAPILLVCPGSRNWRRRKELEASAVGPELEGLTLEQQRWVRPSAEA